MSLWVQKFGGTSVADTERIGRVADKIVTCRQQGHAIIVVLSAMSGETNRLIALAHDLNPQPTPREMDTLLATGEQVTIALLTLALHQRGRDARSYTGAQVKITTDSAHTKARIQHIDETAIRADLNDGRIVVVAGFQGVDEHGNITTLGRGGSDTTAVALAAALKADECQIYTDVNGVYTTDPRMVDSARLLPHLTFDEMLEMSSLGAKVLQIRAVEFASKYHVPLRVLHSFQTGSGTLISHEETTTMEAALISGIAFNRDEAKLTISGIPDIPGVAYQILGPVSDANIEVDVIVQNIADDKTTDLTFTVHRNDMQQAQTILQQTADKVGAKEVKISDKIAKLSLVGVGMRSHAGVASTMFKTLADLNINIQLITTSEIKISVVIDEKFLELAVRSLHSAFELNANPLPAE